MSPLLISHILCFIFDFISCIFGNKDGPNKEKSECRKNNDYKNNSTSGSTSNKGNNCKDGPDNRPNTLDCGLNRVSTEIEFVGHAAKSQLWDNGFARVAALICLSLPST